MRQNKVQYYNSNDLSAMFTLEKRNLDELRELNLAFFSH